MRHVMQEKAAPVFEVIMHRTLLTNNTIRLGYPFTCLFLLTLSFSFEYIVQVNGFEENMQMIFSHSNADTGKLNYGEETLDTFQAPTLHAKYDPQSNMSPNLLVPVIQQSEAKLLRPKRRWTQQNAACSENPVCAAAGLVNDCCPTGDGRVLECCLLTLPPTPTLSPLTIPTDPPIGAPTDPPVLQTEGPTSSPVRPPTIPPSKNPTAPPVIPPTMSPILLPTTIIPTVSPTNAAVTTNAPVTPEITSTPVTSAPISSPSTQPPTSIPLTISPTSTAPTPLMATSPNTTVAPSLMTTIEDGSSEVPSATPTKFLEYGLTNLSIVDVQLILRSELSATRRKIQSKDDTTSDNCTQILQNLLIEKMENEVSSIIQTYETLHVELQNFTTTYSNLTVLTYTFDVLMEIRSPMQEYEPNRYVEGIMDSQVEKRLFTDELMMSDCSAFQNLVSADIGVPRKMENKSTSDNESDSFPVGLVSGIVGACAVLMILIGALFIGVRMIKSNRVIEDESDPIAIPSNRPVRENDEYNMSVVDGVNTNTDISTLGDPFVSERGNGLKADIEDSTLGSSNIDYDYKKAYGDVQSITDSQLMEFSDDSPRNRGHRFGSLDDPSLQNGGSTSDIVTAVGSGTNGSPFDRSVHQFDVVAPSGFLGLILETNVDDGRPMVFSIKPSSPLAHVVKSGDRLIAVDGTDVSKIRASDVSRLIAEKKDKARVLVFSRPTKDRFRVIAKL